MEISSDRLGCEKMEISCDMESIGNESTARSSVGTNRLETGWEMLSRTVISNYNQYFDDENPLAYRSFTVASEGGVNFMAVLFVPPKAPHDLYESCYNSKNSNLKLYVSQVFFLDEFDDLLPKYLNFFKGLVDFVNLPPDISSLNKVKEIISIEAFAVIHKLAEEESEKKDAATADVEESCNINENKGLYTKFWNEFGMSLKLGIIEDVDNRNRLAKLLRFETTKSDGKLASLDQYISRMKSGQGDIFYMTGTSKEQLEKSPFLQRLKTYEVIFCTDPVDEHMMQCLMDYKDKKFKNVAREGLKFLKDLKDKEHKELTKWWKGALTSENIDDVKISNSLTNSPCAVELKSNVNNQACIREERVLKINPRHPIIKALRERAVKDHVGEDIKQMARLVYRTASMESGFIPRDPKDVASLVYWFVKNELNISSDATVEEICDVGETVTESPPKSEGIIS